VVPIEHWRLCFFHIDIYEEFVKKRRFQNALGYLTDRGTVLVWADLAWLRAEK